MTGGPKWHVNCVAGAAGTGKSALFAQLYRRLHKEEGVLLLAHAAGVSPASQGVDNLLKRWIEELAGFLEAPDPAPGLTSREDLQKRFRELLSQAARQLSPNSRARLFHIFLSRLCVRYCLLPANG